MSQLAYFILGTSSMVLMMLAVIWFVYIYQRKLAGKAKAYAEIENLMKKLELESAYLLIQGQELERKRIAAELHDNIGGLLATLKIYSDLSMEKSEIIDIRRMNSKVNSITENLSEEVRKLSHELDLRTLSGFGFKIAVQQLCEAVSSSGKLEVTVLIELQKAINENISLNLYRIIQELITNTLKHAMASQARVEVSLIGSDITLIYEDNGKGFDVNGVGAGGMGLRNIHYRVNQICGKITFDSSPRGTTCIVELNDYE